MNEEARQRRAIRRDAALFDRLGITRPRGGGAREGLSVSLRFGEEGIGKAAGEAAKRGKSLLARLPDWEGQFPRRPAHVPVRGIQPGFCCRCGSLGRVEPFKTMDGEIPRAMDWCGEGRCLREAEAARPAPVTYPVVHVRAPVGRVSEPEPAAYSDRGRVMPGLRAWPEAA